MSVLDYAGTPPAAHYPPDVEGVMRYISSRHADGSRRSKCVTEHEIAAQHAGGRSVGFVFEDGDGNSLGGAAQGDRDGRIAVAEAQLLGVPRDVAIYAAADRDITVPQLATVAAYLDAFHQHTVAAGYRRGVYGEYDVIVAMLRDGHADLGWQASAWSHHAKAKGVPGAALYQGGQIVVDGTTCDVNEVWLADWGQWRATQPAPVPHPQPDPVPAPTTEQSFEEEDVKTALVSVKLGGGANDSGKGWATYSPNLGRAPKIVGTALNGTAPATDGYPAGAPVAWCAVHGNDVIVTVTGGSPGATIGVNVSVA